MNLQFPNILRLVRTKNISLHLGDIKLITSRAGSVMLVSKEFGKAYYGRFIDGYGSFNTGRDWNHKSLSLMTEIERDGLLGIAQIGKALGSCCICGRTLSDERSVKYGIGPICAGNVGFEYPEEPEEELESLDLIVEYEADPMFKLEHESFANSELFDEHHLRTELVRVFGGYSTHVEVYDMLMKKAGVTK